MTTNDKILMARRKASLSQGTANFLDRHPEVFRAEANILFIENYILTNDLPLTDDSWDVAYEATKHQLCSRPAVIVEELQTETPAEKWPYSWMPELKTYADISRKLPGKQFANFYNDKDKSGQLSKRALIFREIVNKIVAEHNAKRGSR